MNPGHFIASYPYLVTNVLVFAVFLAICRMATPAVRQLLMRLAGLMLLTFPFAAVFNGQYWRPVRITPWPLGVEDILCAYNLGAVGLLPTLWLFRNRLRVPDHPRICWRRAFRIGFAAVSALLLLWQISGSSPGALILLQAAGFGLLIILRPDLWRIGLLNGAGFLVMYGGLMALFVHLWPQLGSYWTAHPIWTRPIMGIPLVELVFAATYGAAWAVFAGYVFDLKSGAD